VEKFRSRKIGLAAVSVDEEQESAVFASEIGIDFPLLRDADLKIATAYGVAMAGKDIAVPAVFVIRKDGKIHWRKVGESVTDRPSVSDILEQAEAARKLAP
jgi:peroxiredoxin